MISCMDAGNVEQVVFGVVYILKIGWGGNGFDAFLQGITSSSQAKTATAPNSRPLARCMVHRDTKPKVVSIL